MMRCVMLKSLHRRPGDDAEDYLSWLSESFGLAKGRDTEGTLQRVLKTVLQRAKGREGVRVEDVAQELGVAAQRVNYHVRYLIDAGLLVRERRRLFLRQGSLSAAVEEMQKDAERFFERMKEAAKHIDETFSLE
ncbi:MarR family transcriptional regulator [Candidatus Woesearchaeota archaeon]|nr:MAG: MarR family transcriptional regulator [Candidatus Woesearchaeota archaeon]